MKKIVLTRIDDRLIHGQVVTAWVKQTRTNRILIADDKLTGDRMMQRLLKAAAPPGIKVEVLSVIDAAELLRQQEAEGERIMILVKVPQVLEQLLEQGVKLDKIVLGGMGLTPERRRFNKNVSATADEVACMKRIVGSGVTIEYQLVPEEKAVNVEKLF